MSISRWKLMACSLVFSVAGLAMIAGRMNGQLNAQWAEHPKLTPSVTLPSPAVPVAEKPMLPPSAPETLPPVSPAVEIELVAPVLQLPDAGLQPAGATEPALPMAPRAGDPVPAQPRQLKNYPMGILTFPMPNPVPDLPGTIVPVIATEPAPTPAVPVPQNDIPTVAPQDVPPIAPPTPPAQSLPPQQPPSVMPPVAPAPSPYVPAPSYPLPPAPSEPAPTPPAVQQTSTTTATKLKMLMRLGDGKPRFEIRSSDSTDLLFKVYAQKIEMQQAPDGMKAHPIAGVTAVGQVRFVGPGVEGTCDQLSVLSGTGEVMLKGNVFLKSKHGKAWSEVTAEKMIYQIGASGLTTSASSGSIRQVGGSR